MSEVELSKLEHALRNFWSKETCFPTMKEKWDYKNPAHGQGAATAMVVWNFIGGSIAYNKKFHHYWNRLHYGAEIDFARSQFASEGSVLLTRDINFDEVVSPGEIITRNASYGGVLEMYLKLKKDVDAFLDVDIPYYFMGRDNGEAKLKRKHEIIHESKGTQLNLSYEFEDNPESYNRIVTKLPSGLYIAADDGNFINGFSQKHIDEAVHITNNELFTKKLFDEIKNLEFTSSGYDLHRLMK